MVRPSSSNRAHFRCFLCAQQVWREGGMAVASKHAFVTHGLAGAQLDTDYEMDFFVPEGVRGFRV